MSLAGLISLVSGARLVRVYQLVFARSCLLASCFAPSGYILQAHPPDVPSRHIGGTRIELIALRPGTALHYSQDCFQQRSESSLVSPASALTGGQVWFLGFSTTESGNGAVSGQAPPTQAPPTQAPPTQALPTQPEGSLSGLGGRLPCQGLLHRPRLPLGDLRGGLCILPAAT
jgi:hypothetical protein